MGGWVELLSTPRIVIMQYHIGVFGCATLVTALVGYVAMPQGGESLSSEIAAAIYGGRAAVADAQCEPKNTCSGVANNCGQHIFPGMCNQGAQVDIYAGNRNECVSKKEYAGKGCRYGANYLCKQRKACIWQNGTCVINPASGTQDTNFPSSCVNL